MLGLPTTVTTWWKMQLNLLGIRQQQATNGLKSNAELSQNYFRINSTQSFQLPAGFTAELSGFYQSAKLQGVTRIKPIGTLDIGIQKKIQHNKGTLRFTMTDVFWTFIEREYVNMPENNLVINELYKYEPRIVKLSYSYSFGNSKLKGRRERETGSEDIKNRVH